MTEDVSEDASDPSQTRSRAYQAGKAVRNLWRTVKRRIRGGSPRLPSEEKDSEPPVSKKDQRVKDLTEFAKYYDAEVHRRQPFRQWIKRRAIPGILVGGVLFGGYETTVKEPLQRTAEVTLSALRAVGNLGRATARLIPGNKDVSAIEDIQKKEQKYLEGLNEMLNTYKENLRNRQAALNEMRTAVEGFGRMAEKTPGYQTFRGTGLPALREKINSFMARPFQEKDATEHRLSEDYAGKFNELLDIVGNADAKKKVDIRKVQELVKTLKSQSDQLGRLNSQEIAELEEKLRDVNAMYDISEGFRGLTPSQIKGRSPEYQRLQNLGKKYGLDVSPQDTTAWMIANGVGALLALYGYRKGSKWGNRLIPRGDVTIEQVARDYATKHSNYLENRVEKKGSRQDKPPHGSGSKLEGGISVIIAAGAILSLIALSSSLTGNVVSSSGTAAGVTFYSGMGIILFMISLLLLSRQIYKYRSP